MISCAALTLASSFYEKANKLYHIYFGSDYMNNPPKKNEKRKITTLLEQLQNQISKL